MRGKPYEHRYQGSVPEPRAPLLQAVLQFVRTARTIEGVLRIALVGSLATPKPLPKDADVLCDNRGRPGSRPARNGRTAAQGYGAADEFGADIFLADVRGDYIGRICGYRECHPRVACRARSCGMRGQRDHLKDDLDIVTLSRELIASPPADLWPAIRRRASLPGDVEELLLVPLGAGI